MSFVNKYIDTPEPDKPALISSWLHQLKLGTENSCWLYFNDFDFSLINDTNKVDIVKLAVSIEHLFRVRGWELPEWSRDSRLVLERAYRGRGYQEAWFIFGPQAMMSHNCFFDPGSLEVM